MSAYICIMKEQEKIERQLFKLKEMLEKTPKFTDGKFNKNYFSLKGKIKNLEFELSQLSWNEYLSK